MMLGMWVTLGQILSGRLCTGQFLWTIGGYRHQTTEKMMKITYLLQILE